VAIVITLMGLTWRQTQVWHDSYRLWKHAVEVTDRSPFESVVAHDHLGVALAEQGKFDEAITQFSEALRISPYFARTHNNLGIALALQGRLDEAIAQFSEAVRIAPEYRQAHYNLGTTFLRQGKRDEAVKEFYQGLGAAPTAEMHYQVAVALASGGKIQEAIGELEVALKLDPGYQPARRALERLTASGAK